jgi:chromosome segregation ATPase
MRFFVVPAGIVLTLAGCATQDQLRQTEAQQGQAVQALRAEANRSESGITDLRTEIRRTLDSVHELEITLTDARARTDAAKVQADNALATSREFLANLVAAREEQRRQLDQNGAVFADIRRKLADLETRLQAQQRLLEQNASVLNDGARRLYAVEAGLQETGRRSALLEAKAKTSLETDDGLTRQIATMRKQVDDTRAMLGSGGLLQMMREMEDMRRGSAALRGSIDELQKAQADSSAQSKNYYLDLDSRLRQLKQAAPPPVHQTDSGGPPESAPAPASQ